MEVMLKASLVIILSMMMQPRSVTSQHQCIKLTTSLCDDDQSNSPPPVGSIQGLTGKAGPKGAKGEPGTKGEKGEVDLLQIDLIQTKLEHFESSITDIRNQLITFVEKLNSSIEETKTDVYNLKNPPPSYRIVQTPRKGTFEEVRNMCIEMGGDLLQKCLSKDVYGKNYKQKIEDVLTENYIYIGVSDSATEGDWKYVNGEDFDGFSDELLYKWGDGEPDYVGSAQDCGYLYKPLGVLKDRLCFYTHFGVCEILI